MRKKLREGPAIWEIRHFDSLAMASLPSCQFNRESVSLPVSQSHLSKQETPKYTCGGALFVVQCYPPLEQNSHHRDISCACGRLTFPQRRRGWGRSLEPSRDSAICIRFCRNSNWWKMGWFWGVARVYRLGKVRGGGGSHHRFWVQTFQNGCFGGITHTLDNNLSPMLSK